jgi:hypothetical protein
MNFFFIYLFASTRAPDDKLGDQSVVITHIFLLNPDAGQRNLQQLLP